jgi:hypothetical protein
MEYRVVSDGKQSGAVAVEFNIGTDHRLLEMCHGWCVISNVSRNFTAETLLGGCVKT